MGVPLLARCRAGASSVVWGAVNCVRSILGAVTSASVLGREVVGEDIFCPSMACWCVLVSRRRRARGSHRLPMEGTGWSGGGRASVRLGCAYGQMMSAAVLRVSYRSIRAFAAERAVECASVLQHASPAILLAVAARVKYA